ncbi:MAG: hypothetical protein ACYDCQ_01615 [Dehalococcoidia bacterium]
MLVHDYLLGNSGLYDTIDPVYFLIESSTKRQATTAEITVAAFYRALDRRAARRLPQPRQY